MPFVPIPSTVKLVLRGQAESQDVINVLHYKYVGAVPTSAQLLTFVNAWLSAHKAQYLACHGAQYVLLDVTATDISVANSTTAAVTVGSATGTGTATGIPFPANVAMSVELKTGLAGRRNRGRMYLGGLTDNQADGSLATNSFLSTVVTLCVALAAQTFTGGFDWGVASYKDGATKIITAIVLDGIMDSMRRRLPGRGN